MRVLALLLILVAGPPAPTGFRATATVNSVALAWAYSGPNNISGFQIDRMQTGAYSPLATVNKQARSFLDSTVQPATAYTYRIRSNKGNQSSQYVFVTATTDPSTPDPGPIPPPTCAPTLVVSNDQLIVINAQPVAGLALVQAVVDGNPINPAFTPTPLQPFGQPWEVTPTVIGNFIVVLPTITLTNGCHTIGAFATDTIGQTGKAMPLTIEVRN